MVYIILPVTLLLLLQGQAYGNYVYVGCYKSDPTSYSGLDALIITDTTASKDKCGLICQDAGFRFAGIPNTTSCTCGDVYGQDGEGTCTTNCTGTSTGETCGGPGSSTVYLTQKACFEPYPYQNFLGDIQDGSAEFLLEGIIDLSSKVSKESCEKACLSNANCTSFSYFDVNHVNASRSGRCYGMTVTPSTTILVDTQVNSGKQKPCEDEDENNEVGLAVGVGILSAVLLFIVIHEAVAYKKHKTCIRK